MDFSGIIPALPGLWNGMVMTLQLMVMGVVGGIVLGTILALMRLSSNKLLAQTKQTAEFSANLFEAFTLATLIYFTLNMSLMLLMRMVEKKVAVPGLISVGGK